MSVNLSDLMLKAASDVQSVFMQFEREQQKPQLKSQMAQQWAQLPDELKEKFKTERPDEYEALIRSLK